MLIKRRAGIVLLVVLALVGAGLLVPSWRAIVEGMMARETLFRGKPTRYWLMALTDTNKASADEALDVIAKDGTAAIPMLIEALHDENPVVRVAAGRALGAIGSPAVPALQQELKSPLVIVRIGAIRALRDMGSAGKPALPNLIAATKDEHPLVSVMAIAALVNGGKDAVPALVSSFNDRRDPKFASAALQALQELGTQAKEAFPALLIALKRKGEKNRRAIAETLKIIDPMAAAKAEVP
jgi:HEAT repeat protein